MGICESKSLYKSVEWRLEEEEKLRKKYKNYFEVYIIENNLKESLSSLNQKMEKMRKYNINILYYDELLLEAKENNDNCTFLEINTNGTFYGCHYFELFKIVCEKIINSKKEFILISSGSSAQKVFDHCSNIKEIKAYLIYCFDKSKYLPLINKYPKLIGVYNIFEELKGKLFSIKEMKINNISSSNLLFFEDYNRLYIKLHSEFISKYSLYKLLKSKNCNEPEFLALVKEKYPNFLPLAKQIFPNKEETIKFFLNNTNESEKRLREIFKSDDNILDDNIRSYIHNYTQESFYYRYLNQFLREGDFEAFRTLSSHIAKFIFKLYDYREKRPKTIKQPDLYRKLYLNKDEIKIYQQSIHRVICYPSFTSTSEDIKSYMPNKYNMDDELVLQIIEQNDTKSNVCISELSDYPHEKEYLFLPFSFFKIKKVELRKGNEKDPHIIYLAALSSDKPIEEMFSDFFKNETSALSLEGLDILLLNVYKTKIFFNPIYFSKNSQKKKVQIEGGK